MTNNTLFLNNFKYDYEDDTWYYYDYSFRVIVVYLAYHNVFRLYYGGYDKYLGEYEDEESDDGELDDDVREDETPLREVVDGVRNDLWHNKVERVRDDGQKDEQRNYALIRCKKAEKA